MGPSCAGTRGMRNSRSSSRTHKRCLGGGPSSRAHLPHGRPCRVDQRRRPGARLDPARGQSAPAHARARGRGSAAGARLGRRRPDRGGPTAAGARGRGRRAPPGRRRRAGGPGPAAHRLGPARVVPVGVGGDRATCPGRAGRPRPGGRGRPGGGRATGGHRAGAQRSGGPRPGLRLPGGPDRGGAGRGAAHRGPDPPGAARGARPGARPSARPGRPGVGRRLRALPRAPGALRGPGGVRAAHPARHRRLRGGPVPGRAEPGGGRASPRPLSRRSGTLRSGWSTCPSSARAASTWCTAAASSGCRRWPRCWPRCCRRAPGRVATVGDQRVEPDAGAWWSWRRTAATG